MPCSGVNFSKSMLRRAEGSLSILGLSWLARYTPGTPSTRPKSVMKRRRKLRDHAQALYSVLL